MDTAPPNYPPTHWIPSKSAKHWFVKWSISSSLKCGPLVAPVLLKIVGVCSSSTKNNNQKETFYYSVHEPSTVPLSHCTMSPVRAWRGRILCSLLLWWVAVTAGGSANPSWKSTQGEVEVWGQITDDFHWRWPCHLCHFRAWPLSELWGLESEGHLQQSPLCFSCLCRHEALVRVRGVRAGWEDFVPNGSCDGKGENRHLLASIHEKQKIQLPQVVCLT